MTDILAALLLYVNPNPLFTAACPGITVMVHALIISRTQHRELTHAEAWSNVVGCIPGAGYLLKYQVSRTKRR